MAHTALDGGIELRAESRDGQATVVTELVNGQPVSQQEFRSFGTETSLDCRPIGTSGVQGCSISGVPGAHVSFAAVFVVSAQGITTLTDALFGEGNFYLSSLSADSLLLTTVKLFTDTGLSPGQAPAAWQTWEVTTSSVNPAGCGVPTSDRSGTRPTALLHGSCLLGSPTSPSGGSPGTKTTTTVAAAPDAQTNRDPALNGPASAGVQAASAGFVRYGNELVFQSPSGNIRCALGTDSSTPAGARADCQIGQHTYPTPPKPNDPNCQGVYGISVQITSGGAALLYCAGDPNLPGAPLPFGQYLTVGTVSCLSTRSGVKCEDSQGGHGFILSQKEMTTF